MTFSSKPAYIPSTGISLNALKKSLALLEPSINSSAKLAKLPAVWTAEAPRSNKKPPIRDPFLATPPNISAAAAAPPPVLPIESATLSSASVLTSAFLAIALSTAESCLAMANISASVVSVAALINSTFSFPIVPLTFLAID